MSRKQIVKESFEYIVLILFHQIAKLFWLFPMSNYKVVCISFTGKQYSCNPKYLAESLISRYPGKLKVIFALRHPKNGPRKDIKYVKMMSVSLIYHLCTSKVIISNSGMPVYIPKRKGQYIINTWHGGGAYKKTRPSSYLRKKINRYKSDATDLILSSSKSFSKIIIPDIAGDYHGEIMTCGMPRNDILFSERNKELREKVCKDLNIEISTILILFAPTFRGVYSQGKGSYFKSSINISKVKEAIFKRFGKKSTVMFRAHNSVSNSNLSSLCINVTDYPDIQELLCAVDILITDYSSIMWDFSLVKKPCFLFCPDIETYMNHDVGFYTPIDTCPGILCRTNEELEQAILNFDEAEYIKKVEKHHADLGSYETGHACEQVCKRIAEVCGIEEES